jgi:hypothetical protein
MPHTGSRCNGIGLEPVCVGVRHAGVGRAAGRRIFGPAARDNVRRSSHNTQLTSVPHSRDRRKRLSEFKFAKGDFSDVTRSQRSGQCSERRKEVSIESRQFIDSAFYIFVGNNAPGSPDYYYLYECK